MIIEDICWKYIFLPLKNVFSQAFIFNHASNGNSSCIRQLLSIAMNHSVYSDREDNKKTRVSLINIFKINLVKNDSKHISTAFSKSKNNQFVCMFCLFGIFCPTQESITHLKTSPSPVKCCKF